MWAKVESGSITKLYNSPKNLIIDGVSHPAKIFESWSSSELEAIGIY